jgi:hypothetical protein
MIVQGWAQVETHREDYADCTSLDHDIMVEIDKDMSMLGISLESRTSDCEYGVVAAG